MKIPYKFSCSNGFDPDTGDCLFPEFQDTSELQARENEFRETPKFLTFDQFITICQNEDWINPGWEFYFYPSDEFRWQIYVAYDFMNDIHYFFSEYP